MSECKHGWIGADCPDCQELTALLERCATLEQERDEALQRERKAEEDSFECSGCKRVVSGEPASTTPPHPDDGLPDLYCPGCYEAQRLVDKQMELDELHSRLTALRVALEKYGRHLPHELNEPGCFNLGKCACGLDAALTELKEEG